MTAKRLHLTNRQIDQRIALESRRLRLFEAKALRDGLLTPQQLDDISNQINGRAREPLTVGSTIEWDDHTYRIEQCTPDGVILTKANATTRPELRTLRFH